MQFSQVLVDSKNLLVLNGGLELGLCSIALLLLLNEFLNFGSVQT